MQVLLPVLYERCVGLMSNDLLPAVEIQKQILKIYFAMIQVLYGESEDEDESIWLVRAY